MRTIYDYPLNRDDLYLPLATVKMPKNALIFSVEVHNEQVTVWAIVDDAAPTRDHHFLIFEMGDKWPEEGVGAYVGSYRREWMEGNPIHHVFHKVLT